MTSSLATQASATEATLTASRALLGAVARSVTGALESVTLPQFRVLIVLATSGPLRTGILAERIGAQQSTFTRSLDRMVAGGWVARAASPDSRREILITLTSTGRALVDEVTERRRREIATILGRLSAADQAAVESALSLFSAAAGEVSAEELLILGV